MAGSVNADLGYRALNMVTTDDTYCFAQARPTGAYAPMYRTVRGESITAKYPADPYSVHLLLDEDWPGLKLPSIIGNAGNLIILHKDVSAFIQGGFRTGPVETFAFTLMNHKGRVHSKDYVFFNPLAIRECLDPSAGDQASSTPVGLGLKRLVVARDRLEGAEDIFRIKGMPATVLISPGLIEAISVNGFTNFSFNDVEYTHE